MFKYNVLRFQANASFSIIEDVCAKFDSKIISIWLSSIENWWKTDT